MHNWNAYKIAVFPASLVVFSAEIWTALQESLGDLTFFDCSLYKHNFEWFCDVLHNDSQQSFSEAELQEPDKMYICSGAILQCKG